MLWSFVHSRKCGNTGLSGNSHSRWSGDCQCPVSSTGSGQACVDRMTACSYQNSYSEPVEENYLTHARMTEGQRKDNGDKSKDTGSSMKNVEDDRRGESGMTERERRQQQ